MTIEEQRKFLYRYIQVSNLSDDEVESMFNNFLNKILGDESNDNY